ncbi:hypothetical protein TUM19329_03020 [Legionella antarctica]|uniref:Uncharacterized protein n=1 Tax=Legionella antarctica TaxID=2708020 RepID=A0A6F8T0F3_9GAMM|nr:hypothetical protein [Legionella antarctica]BCA93941.1 hypothetical protein TUM19329_03020 [Legionella antarctica]
MKKYIWYHPLYVLETPGQVLNGQKANAIRNNYVILNANELYKVSNADHLTLVGHSTSPGLTQDGGDTGLYLQGETAIQIVDRLTKSGLYCAPKVLSLECCRAALKDGIAQKLSAHPFFKNSIIEANTSGIGRNPGNAGWGEMAEDIFGRVVINAVKNPWLFLLRGFTVASCLIWVRMSGTKLRKNKSYSSIIYS